MFSEQGFEIIDAVLTDAECRALEAELDRVPLAGAGTRHMLPYPWCADLAHKVRSSARIGTLIPASHVAVQCTYFEKSADRNWLVPLHQDLSIPVAARVDHPNLTGWSEKEGAIYVQPPRSVLEELVAVRVHIDICGRDDGPLKVVPGSHTRGIVTSEECPSIRDEREKVSCLVARGAALVMRPLILHASSKASGSSLRRVLHFLFGPNTLPFGLCWQTAI